MGKELGVWSLGLELEGFRVSDFGVYRDLIMIYPRPYSIYLRGTIEFSARDYCGGSAWVGLRLRIQSLGFRTSNLDEALE